MKPTSYDAIAAALGLLCGALSNYGFLLGSWWNLAFWGIVGVVIGFFAADNKEALREEGGMAPPSPVSAKNRTKLTPARRAFLFAFAALRFLALTERRKRRF